MHIHGGSHAVAVFSSCFKSSPSWCHTTTIAATVHDSLCKSHLNVFAFACFIIALLLHPILSYRWVPVSMYWYSLLENMAKV